MDADVHIGFWKIWEIPSSPSAGTARQRESRIRRPHYQAHQCRRFWGRQTESGLTQLAQSETDLLLTRWTAAEVSRFRAASSSRSLGPFSGGGQRCLFCALQVRMKWVEQQEVMATSAPD